MTFYGSKIRKEFFINSKLTLSLSRSKMGPPGVLCQWRQSPYSKGMAPLFLLNYFPAVSFAVSVHAMLFLYVPRFWPCVPRIEFVAAMASTVGMAPLAGAVFSSVAT